MSRRLERLPNELRELFERVVQEAEKHPNFAEALRAEFGPRRRPKRTATKGRPANRRARGVIDPFEVRAEGESSLREALGQLDVEQLKDIVAEHGMDPGKLAMKWRTAERLIDLIVDTVEMRRTKGSVFRQ